MAQTMTSTAVGRVNRRFLFLALILAVLSAVLAYVALSNRGSGGTASGDEVPVVVAKVPITAGTRITADMVEVRYLPTSAVGDQAVGSVDGLVGQVARYPVAANEQVLLSKVVNTTIASNNALAYVLPGGMRGQAIHVDQLISAGGLVLPGDHVDILWVPFKGAPGFVLLSNVEVTAVSQTIVNVAPAAPGVQGTQPGSQPANGDRTRTSDASPQPDAVTVTMMVTPDQGRSMFCAEQVAAKYDGAIRLAVRAFGDNAAANVDAPPCPPLALMAELHIGP